MKTDLKQYKRQPNCFRRCGKLTLQAQNELDATLLAMLGRAIANDKHASRVRLFRSLMAEFPDHDQPDIVVGDAHLKAFAHLGG